MRTKLPNRRNGVVVKVKWQNLSMVDHHVLVHYNHDDDGKIKEAFVASYRAESDIIALTNDACILFSRLLQHGDTLEELATACTENRNEGEERGRPASLMGAVAREALKVQKYLDERRKSG